MEPTTSSNPFDGKPFELSLVNDVVTFHFDGDPVGYGWGGPEADSDVGCRLAFRVPGVEALAEGIAVTDDVETKLGEFFTANGLDWATTKARIDEIRAEKALVVKHEEEKPEEAPASAPSDEPKVDAPQADAPAPAIDPPTPAPTATASVDVATLPQADAAPMTQRSAPDTHVVVHNDAIHAIGKFLVEAKDGVEGAFEKLEHAFAHVFHHGQ